MKTEIVKHTPGPWSIESRSQTEMIFAPKGLAQERIDAFTGQSLTVAEMPLIARVNNGPLNPEGKANGRLIAAAPELLDKLKKMVQVFTAGNSSQHAIRLLAIEAIAKAEPK